MGYDSEAPLFDHPLEEPTAFSPEALVQAVRSRADLQDTRVPPVCILDFDGDLTDWLVETGRTKRCAGWACFHTSMEVVRFGDREAGVVARTIGGPYAVLVAEQMLVSGVRVVIGLTSAGRVSAELPLPSLAVPTRALRDEGTSLHYLPPSRYVDAPREVGDALADSLHGIGLPVHRGAVWTTDAPYRETATQLREHADEGVLAVEMQSASLFALAQTRKAHIGVVAHLTNGTDHDGPDFDKGEEDLSHRILERIVRAGYRLLEA